MIKLFRYLSGDLSHALSLRSFLFLVAILFLACLFFVSGCSSKDKSAVCAEVNGEKIFIDDLESEIQRISIDPEEAQLESEERMKLLRKEILLQMIDKKMLVQEAKRRSIRISDKDIDAYISDISKGSLSMNYPGGDQPITPIDKSQREDIIEGLMIRRLIGLAIDPMVKINEEEIRAYFLTHKQDFKREKQYHARQIVTESELEAKQILERIKKGEDFVMLAQNYSLSPDRLKGGDLGFFVLGQMPPEFDEMAVNLKVGEVSDVVQSDYGYHIFQLLEVREPQEEDLKRARPQIEKILLTQRRDELFHKWLKTLRESAKIKIYPDSLVE